MIGKIAEGLAIGAVAFNHWDVGAPHETRWAKASVKGLSRANTLREGKVLEIALADRIDEFDEGLFPAKKPLDPGRDIEGKALSEWKGLREDDVDPWVILSPGLHSEYSLYPFCVGKEREEYGNLKRCCVIPKSAVVCAEILVTRKYPKPGKVSLGYASLEIIALLGGIRGRINTREREEHTSKLGPIFEEILVEIVQPPINSTALEYGFAYPTVVHHCLECISGEPHIRNVGGKVLDIAELSILYVTSAGGENRSRNGELAGAVFRIETQTKGRLEYRSRILLL
jgi:hypothetical protein